MPCGRRYSHAENLDCADRGLAWTGAGRTSDEIVQEALSLWEERQANELRQAATPNHTLQQAGIRELRKGNRLPEGETIKGLINYGRA